MASGPLLDGPLLGRRRFMEQFDASNQDAKRSPVRLRKECIADDIQDQLISKVDTGQIKRPGWKPPGGGALPTPKRYLLLDQLPIVGHDLYQGRLHLRRPVNLKLQDEPRGRLASIEGNYQPRLAVGPPERIA